MAMECDNVSDKSLELCLSVTDIGIMPKESLKHFMNKKDLRRICLAQ